MFSQFLAESAFWGVVPNFYRADAHFGSITDIEARLFDVRFTPESGHQLIALGCPLNAKSGHRKGLAECPLYPCDWLGHAIEWAGGLIDRKFVGNYLLIPPFEKSLVLSVKNF